MQHTLPHEITTHKGITRAVAPARAAFAFQSSWSIIRFRAAQRCDQRSLKAIRSIAGLESIIKVDLVPV
jgi:hypothetical protein